MRYQTAKVLKDVEYGDGFIKSGTEGLVCEEKEILHVLDLPEQRKHCILGWFLRTRHDRFLVAFPDGKMMDFAPDDLEVSWCSEVA